jgi:hypothetical protein
MNSEIIRFSLPWWEIMIGGVSTLAIYSFLYKENPLYRFFEHLFMGIATAIVTMFTIKGFFWPRVIKPMLGYDRLPFPDGTYPAEYNNLYLLFLIPIAFGSLYYFILSKRHSWIAQVVIGFSLGIGGGLAFKGTITEFLPMFLDSFRPLYITGDWQKGLSNIIFVFTLLTVFSYFFFTFKRKVGGLAEKSASAGRWMMMGCFGAFFGATIQARMALLVERLQFLIDQWWPNLF